VGGGNYAKFLEKKSAMGAQVLRVLGGDGGLTGFGQPGGRLHPTHPQGARMDGAPKMGMWVIGIVSGPPARNRQRIIRILIQLGDGRSI